MAVNFSCNLTVTLVVGERSLNSYVRKTIPEPQMGIGPATFSLPARVCNQFTLGTTNIFLVLSEKFCFGNALV